MLLKIKKSILNGSIVAPPSKSYAHRYLIASALSDCNVKISNLEWSDDINATLNSIYAYGRNFKKFENDKSVVFEGKFCKTYEPTFDCNESGTTLRIFMPVALAKYDEALFIGKERLIERGIDIYEKIFKSVVFTKDKYTIKTKGTIGSGYFELPGNVSSQYISGLLFVLPTIDFDSEIRITSELMSRDYVLMTLDVLKKCNIEIEYDIEKLTSFKIKGNQEYKAYDTFIEGDYSNAAFLFAFNYFGSNIKIGGLKKDSLQSDKICLEYFDKISNEKMSIIDVKNCIDLAPIMITFASMMHGAKIINTGRLKIKESDRGNAMATELRKCGASIDVYENEIVINDTPLKAPNVTLLSHNDHRIAMALSVLSSKFDIEIDGVEAINKSFPSFIDVLKKLGANI